MGVVSGLVMSYQFGTNWSVFSDKTGPVLGPLMAYEVLSAFFLEAGFLGVMLFGMKQGRAAAAFRRDPDGGARHLLLGLLDPGGEQLDADAGRLRHRTPQGQFVPAGLVGGHLQPVLPVPPRPHGARGLPHHRAGGRRGRRLAPAARPRPTRPPGTMFSMAMWMAALVAPVQILAGDAHGLNTLEHQPAKVMAMEGHFQSHPDGAPLVLFGLPDQEAGHGALRAGDPEAVLADAEARPQRAARRASTACPRTDWPPVPIVFWSFRVMVGLGLLMLLARGSGAWSRAGAGASCTSGGRCTGSRWPWGRRASWR